MFVTAMEVLSRMKHPNADTLSVYEFGVDGNTLQVVANSENAYAPGDVVAVAEVGAVLMDGTVIKRARLRGIDSRGMAMGTTDAALGADLTDIYAIRQDNHRVPPVKWPSIELLHNLVRSVGRQKEYHEANGEPFTAPTITYRAKVKLDGTNAVIQISPDGVVTAQGRNRTLSTEDDNHGFAVWVSGVEEKLSALRQAERVVLFGEWCGRGVQRHCAISQIPRKIFAVFAAKIGDTLLSEPEELEALVPKLPDVFVLPWFGRPITLTFDGSSEGLEAAVGRLNALVEEVEGEDPWVAETFGVSGIGEGLVFYPDPREELPSFLEHSEVMFKAKGEKHRVVRQKKAVQVDPEVAKSIDEFVALFVTEPRLKQALDTAFGEALPDMKGTGVFLKTVAADVIKESVDELEASGLTWKQVARAVSTEARTWFMAVVRAT